MGSTRRGDGNSEAEPPAPEGTAGSHAERADASSRSSLRSTRVRFEPAFLSRDLAQVAAFQDQFVTATEGIKRLQAQQLLALSRIQELTLEAARAPAEIDVALRSRAAECAAPIGVSDRAVLGMMGEAHQLVILFPRTHTALSHARISLQHAKTIVSEGGAVGDQLRPRYEALCLREAVKTTPGRLRSKAREIAQLLQPRSVDERHQLAAAKRTVWVTPLPDGMAEIGAVLPAVLAYGIKDRVDRIAKAVKRHAVQASRDQHSASTETSETSDATSTLASPTLHPRTRLPLDFDNLTPEAQQRARATAQMIRDTEAVWSLDTFRADAFAELLLNGDPSANATGTGADPNLQATISLTIPVGGTAILEGYGPIDAITARQFAAVAPGWDHTTLAPDESVLSTERRQPTEAMRRILRARDRHCRYPGCYVPVESCEIDHTIEWAQGGATEISNLSHLCPKHHALKHPDLSIQVRWLVQQDDDGLLYWRSPLNEVLIDHPERKFRAKSNVRRGPPGGQVSAAGAPSESASAEARARESATHDYWAELDSDCSGFGPKSD